MDTPPSTRKRGFKLEFPGDDAARDSLRSKFQQIKQCSSERLTNSDVINKVLDFWISSNMLHVCVTKQGTKLNGPCPLGPKETYGMCVPPAKAYTLLTGHLITGLPLRSVPAYQKWV